MPLSKARRIEYMREYRKRTRYNVIPKLDPKPRFDDVFREGATNMVEEIPLYNSSKHKAGDTVRINGRVVKIPELDGSGQPIPEI